MNIHKIIYYCYSRFKFDRLFLNNSPRVLFYHGVSDNITNPAIETESIAATDFEMQLQYIVRHFIPISVDEFYNRYINNCWEGREILLTFDDGYRNLLTTGLPLLEKYNVPFVLFATVDNISENRIFPTTINRLVNLAEFKNSAETDRVSKLLKTEPIGVVERICENLLASLPPGRLKDLRDQYSSVNPMSWNEVLQIAKSPLCTIGSHCMTHICCHSRQNTTELLRQINESKAVIEKKLDKSCDYLAWPNGNYTAEAEKLAAEAGYKMAFSTKYKKVDASGIMSVGRIYVPYQYDRFKYSISRFGH